MPFVVLLSLFFLLTFSVLIQKPESHKSTYGDKVPERLCKTTLAKAGLQAE